MHRMPLFLRSPCKLWNRTSPEYNLFPTALNQGNVREMNDIIDMLEVEWQRQFVHELKYAIGQVNALDEVLADNRFLHNKEAFKEVMSMLRTIILRAPRDCLTLQIAFFLRGRIFFLKFYLKATINDLTFYLDLREPGGDDEKRLAMVHGMMTICYYFVREDSNALTHLKLYQALRANLSTELFLEPDFAVIEHHINQFEDEISTSKLTLGFADEINTRYLVKGFPMASTDCFYACSARSADMSSHFGLFAKSAIPQDSTVLMEDPFVSELATPYIQCEVCFSYPLEVYSCLECRYKTYCSLDCMTADLMHRHECAALKDLMLLILDARSLFGVFVRVSDVLKELVFRQRSFTKMDYVSVFKGIEEFGHRSSQTVAAQSMHINFMKKMPQYDKLTDMQYSTLVATALRLTVYIERKTDFIPKYYGSLHLSNKQTLILIGAILMRIQGHLLLKTFDFDLKLPLVGANEPSEVKLRTLRPYKDGEVSDLNKFYKVNEAKELRKCQQKLAEKSKNVPSNKLPEVEHIKPCHKITRIVSSYMDHIAELYFSTDQVNSILYGEASGLSTGKTYAKELCRRINAFGDAERLSFAQTFVRLFHAHFTDFFINHRIRHNVKRQTLSIYSGSLAKFAHSCDPSVTIIVLDNGIILAKTTRDIGPHEELTVSYKANHTIHSRSERNQFLENIGIWCRCNKCTEPIGREVTEVRSGLRCRCGRDSSFITPSKGKCSLCLTSYDALLENYQLEISKFDQEIAILESKHSTKETTPNLYDADERELYMLYKLRYKHARKNFASGHDFRIKSDLMYAKFLARKNFAQIAHSVILDLKDGLMQFNDEVWFTYSEELLDIIMRVLAVNLDEGWTAISTISLLDLCHVAWDITQGQRKNAFHHDIWDSKCTSIEDSRRSLRIWKEKICVINMLPLSECLVSQHANKKPDGNLPALVQNYY